MDEESAVQAVGLADRALRANARGDQDAAAGALEEIAARFGRDGLTMAARRWAATAMSVQGGPFPDATTVPVWDQLRRGIEEAPFVVAGGTNVVPVRVVVPPRTGTVTGGVTMDASRVTPDVGWAGQLIAAAARSDEAACEALLAAAAAPETGLRWLGVLLDTASATAAVEISRRESPER